MVNVPLLQVSLVFYALGTVHYQLYLVYHKALVERMATWLAALGFFTQTLFVLFRGLESGYLPITNLFEALNFFAWAIVFSYFVVMYSFRVRIVGAIVFPIVLLLMVFSLTLEREIVPLIPALQSKWLWFHTTLCFLGDAFFVLAFAGGVLYLLQERQLKSHAPGTFSRRLPSLDLLDRFHYRCVTLGFPLLTLGIITGAIWAEYAWGSYWSWDPKEIWSLITWLIYAALVHARITVGWRGRKAAYLSVAGFAAVLFTFLGVNLLLSGLHTYN